MTAEARPPCPACGVVRIATHYVRARGPKGGLIPLCPVCAAEHDRIRPPDSWAWAKAHQGIASDLRRVLEPLIREALEIVADQLEDRLGEEINLRTHPWRPWQALHETIWRHPDSEDLALLDGLLWWCGRLLAAQTPAQPLPGREPVKPG